MQDPFQFNELKHHLGAIGSYIINYNQPLAHLKKALSEIGESQMDLYTGQLKCGAIYKEIGKQLLANHHFSKLDFKKWIITGGGYQMVELSDESKWVLRISESSIPYIHVHPARYSKYTVRVKASHLKTAIAFKILQLKEKTDLSVSTINYLRTKHLFISPIKKLIPGKGLHKVISLVK